MTTHLTTLRRSTGLLLVAALVVAGTVALPGGPVTADEDPEHVPWTALLPPLPAGYEASAENPCPRGQVQCVDVVIREMQRRYGPLAAACDHDAVFALTYLRTTEAYRRAVDDPAFFADNAFMNKLDVGFAAAYFDAYDRWHGTATGEVPRAWRIAFDAADRRAVNGTGNLLLGMNAHVNRDLPFVLAALGIVAPDGTTRKADHDRVNDILIGIVGPVLAEAADRFDPTIGATSVDGTTLDETALFQLLASWREGAWRNAERLASAGTDAERRLVAASIEDAAAAQALLLREQTAYPPLVGSSSARDAYCAQQAGE